ncbi:MAG: UDP-N-acetylmuramoylalanyl-D-glutamyl-2,6-diaminopimelate--D-alanyl-D-alanine ligase [Hyphomicrobiaceae bacterium]
MAETDTPPLWRLDALLAAAGGRLEGPPGGDIAGVSIDTRTLQPGDLFVALKAERDGHDFVASAFARGAAAALVAETFAAPPGIGPLIRVADPLAALEAIGRAARTRLHPGARVIAVTGSVGKTGTKEALRSCLALAGPTHASEKSYNNQWGVPLTLARMPAGTRFAILEIGMNHSGEITPLSRMARPHLAIVTTVAPVHIEFFASETAIADAKAEIFAGLEPGGVAILNRDNPHFDRLAAHAREAGAARILAFGSAAQADARVVAATPSAGGTRVEAVIDGEPLAYRIGAPGTHYVMNSLAVLAAVKLAGADIATAARALADIAAPVGRGARTRLAAPGGTILLIDESYNANPASVGAALAAMATASRTEFPRRIAVLGDMRELGARSDALHVGLLPALEAAGIDRLFASGPHMRTLFDAVPATMRALHAPEAAGLEAELLAALRAGDVVMVKGSLGSRMGPLVEAIRKHFADAGAG